MYALKLWLSYPHIFTIWSRKPLIFQTINSISLFESLKYKRPSEYQDIRYIWVCGKISISLNVYIFAGFQIVKYILQIF